MGSSGARFNGSFDGRGHYISGLTIQRPGTRYVGLFGYAERVSMYNVNLIDVDIGGGSYVGALLGYGGFSSASSIENVNVSGQVKGLVTAAEPYVDGLGGVVGAIQVYGAHTINLSGLFSSASIENVYSGAGGLIGTLYANNGASIIVTQSAFTGSVSSVSYYSGGLVGSGTAYNASELIFQDVYSTGNIQANINAAGLCGNCYAYSGNITFTNVYASGAVSNGSGSGGIVGYGNTYQGTLTFNNVFWDTETTGKGGAVGSGATPAGATGLTTAQARDISSYTGFDFGNVWYMADGETRPFLRAEHSTVISNANQLQLVGMDADTLRMDYRLVGDIDLGTALSAASGMWGAKGFIPIGRDISFYDDTFDGDKFSGVFEGGLHTISGLTMDRGDEHFIGLFGGVGAGGEITGLTLENVDVTGIVAGGLVAMNSGSVSRTRVSGSVENLQDGAVGGLVACNLAGAISQSYSTATVIGIARVGGLVGLNYNGSTISDAYASGNVSANYAFGGLAGENYMSDIIRTYATGAVTYLGGQTADSYSGLSGGLVGAHFNNATISQSYATGAVSGGGANGGGGLVGNAWASATVSSSFWDMDTTGQPQGRSGASLSGATGLTSAGFLDTNNFMTIAGGQGWDFETYWAPPDSTYHPALYALSPVIRTTVTDASMVYGDIAPTMNDGAIYGGTSAYVFGPANDELNLSGLLTGQEVADLDVGTHSITGSSAPVESMMGIEYRAVSTAGTLTVTARSIDVTAQDQSRAYGDANPALGFTTSDLGLGAALQGSLVTAATETSNAGVYAITQGTVTEANNSNYIINFVGADLTISKRALTVTADDASRVYGDANPAFGAAVTGGSLAAHHATLEDALADLAVSTSADAQSDVGVYAITVSGSNGNYDLTFADGDLTIGKRALTVTADDASKIEGEPNPVFTASFAGFAPGQDSSVLSGSLVFDSLADESSPADLYAITPSGLSSINYEITYVDGVLTVTARPVNNSGQPFVEIFDVLNRPAALFGEQQRNGFLFTGSFGQGNSGERGVPGNPVVTLNGMGMELRGGGEFSGNWRRNGYGIGLLSAASSFGFMSRE